MLSAALSLWVRSKVWRADDWRAALVALNPEDPEKQFEAARALELVEPDRRIALAAYVAAWRGSHAGALDHVRRLARELRAHDTLAEVALADGDQLAAGAAFLDAGKPERALEPLAKVAQERPKDADVKALLLLARRELRDPHAEVSRCIARAGQVSRAEQIAIFTHAARVARASGLDELEGNLLATALKRCPDDAIATLAEERLLARGHADALLEHYRGRFELARDDREWVTRVLGAATSLVVRDIQRGFGLRLVRRGLENAYGAKLVDIPGHIAAWSLLLAHARQSHAERELVPLVVEALKLPLPPDVRLYVALAGFELVAEDRRAYTAVIAELVPDHPLIRPVIVEIATELADDDVEEVVESTPPPIPAARASQPIPRPSAVIPPAALAALRATRAPALPPVPALPANAVARAARAVVPIDVEVATAEVRFAAVARDLSTSGVFVVTPLQLVHGAVVTLQLHLPGTNPFVQLRHGISAKVVRKTDAGYGLAFVAPSPEVVSAITGIVDASATG